MRGNGPITRGAALLGSATLMVAIGVPMTVSAVAAPQVSPTSASGFTYSVVSTVPVGFEPVGIGGV